MSTEGLLQFVPSFVLIFFRIAGMMIFAPLFGSSRIPRRVKLLIALVLAMGMAGGITQTVPLPESMWELTLGIGGELLFGLAIGMVLSTAFIAAQWAGEMIGQQMGLNLSQTFDPQYGQAGSLIGDVYFWLTLVIFLTLKPLGGYQEMIRGVHASFSALPLLSVGADQTVLDIVVGFFVSATILSVQLAAPMFVSMLMVDLCLGFLSKTMPQLNIMSAGLTIRSGLGMAVLIVGLMLTSEVIRDALMDSMFTAQEAWRGSGN